MFNLYVSSKSYWLVGIALAILASTSSSLWAQSPVKIRNYEATIDSYEDGSSVFEFFGEASHLGRFAAFGEVTLVSGPEGSKFGDGVVVFEAADSDRLVGVASWILGPVDEDEHLETSVHFSWRDSIVLKDGTTVMSTGRFAGQRPPGLVIRDPYCCTTTCYPIIGCITRCEKCPTR